MTFFLSIFLKTFSLLIHSIHTKIYQIDVTDPVNHEINSNEIENILTLSESIGNGSDVSANDWREMRIKGRGGTA